MYFSRARVIPTSSFRFRPPLKCHLSIYKLFCLFLFMYLACKSKYVYMCMSLILLIWLFTDNCYHCSLHFVSVLSVHLFCFKLKFWLIFLSPPLSLYPFIGWPIIEFNRTQNSLRHKRRQMRISITIMLQHRYTKSLSKNLIDFCSTFFWVVRAEFSFQQAILIVDLISAFLPFILSLPPNSDESIEKQLLGTKQQQCSDYIA